MPCRTLEPIGHRGSFKEFSVFHQPGILVVTQVVHQSGPQLLDGIGIGGITCQVLHLVRILFHAVELLAGTLAVGMIEKGFTLGSLRFVTIHALVGPASSSAKVTKVWFSSRAKPGSFGVSSR